jgi:ATP/ADP translocase
VGAEKLATFSLFVSAFDGACNPVLCGGGVAMKKSSKRGDSWLNEFIDRFLLPIAALILMLAVAVYLLYVWLP